ncbi:alpha/beta hydrolase [Naasia lichenicola]|uniref:Alpha/beta hydrolase n=1 Tax=Naasia lichenicola TaxID=2565933 RepID=A0A4S4FSZ3_9MICO|nr:alpha/beta hydrolase [Naasia lichenicola]THG32855.1 alpha/beta hydrolase [Naasia lichenicola]
MGRPGRPVVFIHGLWKGVSIWSRWVDRFIAEGYRAEAPTWPGERTDVEETRSHSKDLEGISLDDAVRHFEDRIAALDEPPIVVGHSFGALIAERLLADGVAIAAVAIDPAQSGNALPGSIERLRLTDPDFGFDPLGSSIVTMTVEQFHNAFCTAASDDEAASYYERFYIPASVNPLLEVASDGFRLIRTPPEGPAGPLLLLPTNRPSKDLIALEDPSILAFRDSISVEQNFEFLGIGHSLVFDENWEQVANVIVDWLEEKGLRN